MIPLNPNLSALERSKIRVYTNLARETPGCVMLTIGEPDLDTPAPICEAANDALRAGRTHYAPNQGTIELRRAIAEFETVRGNVVCEDEVLVTVGACQALFTAMLGVLERDDEIIVPTPCFNLYASIARIAGARVVPLDISRTGFQIDPDALRACITPKTKAILLNSPSNPSGTILNAESLLAVKRAILGKPIYLIWDGVYSQLSFSDCPDLTCDTDLHAQTILCQSFSKPYAMTGWRIGYLTCPAEVMDRLLLLSAFTITAVPTFAQDAAVVALQTDTAPMREIYRARRDYVCERLRAMHLSFPAPEGAFYVFPSIEKFGLSSDEFCTRMIREGGVAAVPGSCFGADTHIRLSYCCADAVLKTGLDRMEAFLKTL